MLQNAHLETNKTYIASEDLMKTVNIAMTLKKPSWSRGPGTSKTMLAQAIADALEKAPDLEHQIHHKGPGQPLHL